MKAVMHKGVALVCLLALAGSARSAAGQCAWQPGPTFPSGARKLAAAVNQNGTLVVLGGRPLIGGQQAPVDSLAPGASNWVAQTPLDFVIFQPGVGLDPNGSIIVVGGWSFDNTGPGFFPRLNGFFYDSVGGEGGPIAGLNCSRSFFGFASDPQSRFYVISGLDRVGASQLITDCVERYLPGSDLWEALAPLPQARQSAAAVYDGQGHVLVIGGGNASGSPQSTVFSLDVATGVWSTITPQPTALQAQSAALGADGLVYVLGGYASNSNFPVASVFVLDPVVNTWSIGPSLATARQAAATARDNDGFIWALGGSGSVGTATTEKLMTAPSGADCNMNGIPDACEPDCNGNGIPDDCDITSGFSADLNTNGVPDECDQCVFDTDCNDAVGCTVDTCQAVTAICVFTPDSTSCDDGNLCTSDTCDPALGCINADITANCDDTNVCTDDSCNPATGCTNANNTLPCDDTDVCTEADVCGGGVCAGVNVPRVTVNMDVESLAPPTVLVRRVNFVLTDCSLGSVITPFADVSFDTSGSGTAILEDASVDTAADFISVREGHTLRRLSALSFDGCNHAIVDLTAAGSGKLLVAGDWQNTTSASQDGLVDIVDFSILASNWSQPIDSTLATGADATGDGIQDTADFTVLQVNFFEVGEAADGCVNRFAGNRKRRDGTYSLRPRSRLPIQVLSDAVARAADVNADGVVDANDIREFAWQYDLPLLPEFNRKLEEIERVAKAGKSGGNLREQGAVND